MNGLNRKLISKNTLKVFALMAKTFLVCSTSLAVQGGEVVSEKNPAIQQIVVIFNQKNFKFCTGTLIQKNIVITASHCIDDNWSRYLIVIGVDPYDTKAEHQKIKNVIAKKTYKTWPLEERAHDLALIKLAGSFEKATAARLAPENWADLRSLTYTAYGYGNTQNRPRLSVAQFRLGNQRLADRILLVSPQAPRQLGPGDSGGPAFLTYENKNYLIGIVSGRHLQTGETVYASVLNSIDWIEKSLRALNQK